MMCLELQREISRRSFIATPVVLATSHALSAANPKPNVILIDGGTWRAQALPWAGDPDVVAPNLARFAAQAVTFSRAYACYGNSDRPHQCLLKGVFPHVLPGLDATSVVSNDTAGTGDPLTLTAMLRAAGYRTKTFRSRDADEIVSFIHSPDTEPFFLDWSMENIGNRLMERANPSELHVRENVPREVQSRSREDLAVFHARARTRDRDIGVVLEALNRPLRGSANQTLRCLTAKARERYEGFDMSPAPLEATVNAGGVEFSGVPKGDGLDRFTAALERRGIQVTSKSWG